MDALRVRNFWPYFIGNLFSNCGTWFHNIAVALLIYRLTGSTFLVGVVNFAQFIGTFAVAPWAGSFADRFDRRRLIIVSQVCAFVVSALLAALQGAGLATTPVVMGLVGVALMSFLLVFVVPKITKIFEDTKAVLPLPTRILVGLSNFLQNYWYVVILLAVGAFFALKKYRSKPAGRRFF